MENLAIIVARAGSKGLPDKCVRPLLGRPLIHYTIDHARASRRLSAIVLSTDSEPAKQCARERGVEIIDRPAELAHDTAHLDAVLRHAVAAWEARHGRRVDAVVMLYANVPLRGDGAIDAALALLESSGADSVRTVAPIGKHHPDWLHRLDGDRMRQYRVNSIDRRQDLEPLFYHDGAVVAVTRAALFDAVTRAPGDAHGFLGADRRAIVQRAADAVDIDEASDLCLAEALLRSRARGDDGASAAPVRIGARDIGRANEVYIIAEAGVNHDGDASAALELVAAAAAAGADALKVQVFQADKLTTAAAGSAAYQQACGYDDQRAMLKRLELDDAALGAIRDACRQHKIEFLATPFDADDVRRLSALGVPAIKLASTDLDNLPLIGAAVETGLPLILSTGAADEAEVTAAMLRLQALDAADRTILLHCVSAYPTPLADANLRAIASLAERFARPTGFSDHTLETETGALAVAAGACVLEKHFTLDRARTGPDHAMSLTPDALAAYVRQARAAAAALGSGRIEVSPIEADVRRVARRSIVAARTLTAGTVLGAADLAVKRPGGGIAPTDIAGLIGRQVRIDVPADAPLRWEDLS